MMMMAMMMMMIMMTIAMIKMMMMIFKMMIEMTMTMMTTTVMMMMMMLVPSGDNWCFLFNEDHDQVSLGPWEGPQLLGSTKAVAGCVYVKELLIGLKNKRCLKNSIFCQHISEYFFGWIRQHRVTDCDPWRPTLI